MSRLNWTPIVVAVVGIVPTTLALFVADARSADRSAYQASADSTAARMAYLAGQVAELRLQLAEQRGERNAPTATALTAGALAQADSAARADPAARPLPRPGLAQRLATGITARPGRVRR